ncbi:MAG: copper resistance protein NlpE [Chitinophagales bacterium]|nr:copper resistance protein NlpE N-terminal domain-containing protein [Bacteroidota bacterium]
MKTTKITIIATACILFFAACNNTQEKETKDTTTQQVQAETANWRGTYTGTIPCASCPGIDVKITLNENETYEKTTTYQESDMHTETTSGKFEWSADKSKINLDNENYKVGENQLTLLDAEGNEPKGELAPNYILTKK